MIESRGTRNNENERLSRRGTGTNEVYPCSPSFLQSVNRFSIGLAQCLSVLCHCVTLRCKIDPKITCYAAVRRNIRHSRLTNKRFLEIEAHKLRQTIVDETTIIANLRDEDQNNESYCMSTIFRWESFKCVVSKTFNSLAVNEAHAVTKCESNVQHCKNSIIGSLSIPAYCPGAEWK